MAHGPRSATTELPIHVTEDGRVFVHVGSRSVETSMGDLERILDRLATEGGRVLYSRDDPAEPPDATALEVMELVAGHRLPMRLAVSAPDEAADADL
jgi:hypothetical protein